MQPKPLHILISPLDWGLGHAARCVPVITQLLKSGHKVTLAGYGRSFILLQKEFPFLEAIGLQGFSPSYSRSGNMLLHLLLLLPQFVNRTLSEHNQLKKLISKYHFDVVISDNRYGLWNKSINSILITHQVMIKTPQWLRFAEYPLYRFSRLLISRFDECWIPDGEETPGLSGDLSHKYALPVNAKYIGPLSRFRHLESSSQNEINADKFALLISGPEPQRTMFEDLVITQLAALNCTATIISGKPESVKTAVIGNKLTVLPHLATNELNSVLTSSSLVICRSGYSSIMDLQALGVKVLFIPTPGQTEQIYLAKLHQQSGTALWRTQKTLNLETDIAEALKYPGFRINKKESGLQAAIEGLQKK